MQMSARRGSLFHSPCATPPRLTLESVARSDLADFVATVAGLLEAKVAAVTELGWDSLLNINCPRLVGPIWRLMINGTHVLNKIVIVLGHEFELNGASFERLIGIWDGDCDFDLGGTTDTTEYGLLVAQLCDATGKIQYSRLKEDSPTT